MRAGSACDEISTRSSRTKVSSVNWGELGGSNNTAKSMRPAINHSRKGTLKPSAMLMDASGNCCRKLCTRSVVMAPVLENTSSPIRRPTAIADATVPMPVGTVAFTLQLIGEAPPFDPQVPLAYRAHVWSLSQGYFVEQRELWSDDADELRAWGKQRLAAAKVPSRVVFVAELPRTATGKLQKYKLREPLWAGKARTI